MATQPSEIGIHGPSFFDQSFDSTGHYIPPKTEFRLGSSNMEELFADRPWKPDGESIFPHYTKEDTLDLLTFSIDRLQIIIKSFVICNELFNEQEFSHINDPDILLYLSAFEKLRGFVAATQQNIEAMLNEKFPAYIVAMQDIKDNWENNSVSEEMLLEIRKFYLDYYNLADRGHF